jgi:hypothetical protein
MFPWRPDPDIETSAVCSCGTFVTLTRSENPYASDKEAWVCLCMNCTDGAPDAGPGGSIQGNGATPGAALWDWYARHDEVHEVEWAPTDLFAELARQVSDERTRTRGWIVDSTGGYGPGIALQMEEALAAAGIDPAVRGAW